MISKNILVASILGGIVLFLWGAFSHMVLPLGEVGLQGIPNEDQVLSALSTNIQGAGLYFFPWISEQTDSDMAAWEEKYRTGPAGLLVYRPLGGEPMTAGMLLTELVTDIIAALLGSLLMMKALSGLPTFGARVFFCTILGLFGSVLVNTQYWNWYGFPGDYTVAAILDDVIGFTFVGMVLSWKLRAKQA